jgi:hypothetical protein
LAALITGAVALVLGAPISLGTLGIVGGLVGLVLGIVGLRRVARDGVGGKGLAIGGIAVSVVAVLAGGVLLTVLGPDFLRGFERGFERGWDQASTEAQGDATQADDELPADSPENDAPDSTTGIPLDQMNPDGEWVDMPISALGLGEPATVGAYTVTITAIDLNASSAVMDTHRRNPLPYGRYVMATLSATYRGMSEGTPVDDLVASYPGADDYIYDETTCGAVTARPVAAIGSLDMGETVEYDICFDVPIAAIDEPRILVHDIQDERWAAKAWLAAD